MDQTDRSVFVWLRVATGLESIQNPYLCMDADYGQLPDLSDAIQARVRPSPKRISYSADHPYIGSFSGARIDIWTPVEVIVIRSISSNQIPLPLRM